MNIQQEIDAAFGVLMGEIAGWRDHRIAKHLPCHRPAPGVSMRTRVQRRIAFGRVRRQVRTTSGVRTK